MGKLSSILVLAIVLLQVTSIASERGTKANTESSSKTHAPTPTPTPSSEPIPIPSNPRSPSSEHTSPTPQAPQCGPQTLTQYATCCANQDTLSVHGQHLSGYLPGSFTAPRTRLDLGENPELCGTVRSVPSDGMVLTNSGVRLDLGDASSSSPHFGITLLQWLAAGDLKAENLKGFLHMSQSVQVCRLLEGGSLAVPNPGAEECEDRSHVTVYPPPSNAVLARTEYNKHYARVNPGMQCGDEGAAARKRIVITVWSVVLCLVVPVVTVGLLRRRYCCMLGWTLPKHADKACLALLLCGAITISVLEWLNYFELAVSGQIAASEIMSWLLFACYTLLPLVLVIAGIAYSAYMMQRHIEYSALIASNCCPVMLVLFVIAAVFTGLAARIILAHPHYTVPTLCAPTALLLCWWLIGCCVPALFAFIVLLVMLKVLHSPHIIKLHLILAEVFIIVKGIILGASVAAYWVQGVALLPTADYVTGALFTALGVVIATGLLLDMMVNPHTQQAEVDMSASKTLTMLTDFYPTPRPSAQAHA